MEFNQILTDYLGEIGKYQLFVILLLVTLRSPSFIHNIGYVFFAATPPHWCNYSSHNDVMYLNDTTWKIFSIPSKITAGEREFESCVIYKWADGENLTTANITWRLDQILQGQDFPDEYKKKCNQWQYDLVSGVKSSVVTEHDMVCDRAWMKSVVGTSYAIGWLIASPIVGYVADRIGRKKVLVMTGMGTVVFGITLPFSSNYIAFLVIRILLSMSLNSLLGICYTTCIEVVGPSWRTLVSNIYFLTWAVGYMLIAVVAYFLRDRFIFMISVAAPTAIILVTVWFVPESVLWFIATGKIDKAMKIIQRMAKVNKRKIPEDIELTIPQKKDDSTISYLDLVRTPKIRIVTIILSFNWFVCALLFYAIAWNTSDLSGSIYLNTLLSGAAEVPAYLFNVPIVQKFGRKIPMAGGIFISGVLMLLTLAVPGGPAIVGLTTVSKFFITMAFATAYQYTVELYPTVIRSTGLMTCNMMARFGTLLAPFLPLLGTQIPQVVCGSTAILASLTLILLPETLNVVLPTTVQEAERHIVISWRNIFETPWSKSIKQRQIDSRTVNTTVDQVTKL